MIRTERLVLRPIAPADHAALVAVLSDPLVMADLVRDPSAETARASIERHLGYRESHGLGFWVVTCEERLAGFCGLKPGAPDTPIEGEVEIGWMFDRPYWGRGLAAEAARASLDWGWAHSGAARIVAITSEGHAKSRRLMDRIGMRHLPGADFDHPAFGPQDPMRRSVTYAIDRPA
jgi:RimJ/RimL family protein N-acetyltransferase